MNALDAELALDRLEARLAAELPANIAASAHAYAHDSAVALAIEITTREVNAVIAARTFADLRVRATGLWRVIAPMVIERAPSVIAAHARERTWATWRELTTARDAEARRRFGIGYRDLVHALAGTMETTSATSRSVAIPTASPEWSATSTWVTDEHIEAMWAELRQGAEIGALSITRSASAHPRTFVVERGVRAIIVVPARIDSAAACFAVLHELGHALLWLAPVSKELEWPRTIDEAAASFVARAMEDSISDTSKISWYSPLAKAARDRRLVIARALDAIEGGAEPGDIEKPPWALWNDPYAQSAYVDAERLADTIPTDLRGHALADHLAEAARMIDARRW